MRKTVAHSTVTRSILLTCVPVVFGLSSMNQSTHSEWNDKELFHVVSLAPFKCTLHNEFHFERHCIFVYDLNHDGAIT